MVHHMGWCVLWAGKYGTFRVFTVNCDVILQCSDQTSVWDCRKFHAISSIYRTGNEVSVEGGEDVA